MNDLFYVIGGHIIKPFTFLEFSRLLNPSVPCRGLLFLSYTPHLPPVNRFSIRQLPRFSVKLEYSSLLPNCVILPTESVNERIVARSVLLANRMEHYFQDARHPSWLPCFTISKLTARTAVNLRQEGGDRKSREDIR